MFFEDLEDTPENINRITYIGNKSTEEKFIENWLDDNAAKLSGANKNGTSKAILEKEGTSLNFYDREMGIKKPNSTYCFLNTPSLDVNQSYSATKFNKLSSIVKEQAEKRGIEVYEISFALAQEKNLDLLNSKMVEYNKDSSEAIIEQGDKKFYFSNAGNFPILRKINSNKTLKDLNQLAWDSFF